MSVKRLIVNADDLGRSPRVNAGVIEAHRRGVVTSTSAMVNAEAAAGIPEVARACPQLGVGLHLQLTAGRPVLAPEKVRTLVDDDGRLPPDADGLFDADPSEVLAESRAQLTRFRELLGRDPTHFDGHHHCHRLPSVFAAMIAMARETGRPVRAVDSLMRGLLRRESVATVDRVIELPFDEPTSVEALVDVVRALPSGTSELFCHPAAADAGAADARSLELRALTDGALRAALAGAAVALVSFAEV